jgi:hypothetical protein
MTDKSYQEWEEQVCKDSGKGGVSAKVIEAGHPNKNGDRVLMVEVYWYGGAHFISRFNIFDVLMKQIEEVASDPMQEYYVLLLAQLRSTHRFKKIHLEGAALKASYIRISDYDGHYMEYNSNLKVSFTQTADDPYVTAADNSARAHVNLDTGMGDVSFAHLGKFLPFFSDRPTLNYTFGVQFHVPIVIGAEANTSQPIELLRELYRFAADMVPNGRSATVQKVKDYLKGQGDLP